MTHYIRQLNSYEEALAAIAANEEKAARKAAKRKAAREAAKKRGGLPATRINRKLDARIAEAVARDAR